MYKFKKNNSNRNEIINNIGLFIVNSEIVLKRKNTETAVSAIKMFPKKFLKKNLIDFIIQTRKFDFSIIRLVKYMF